MCAWMSGEGSVRQGRLYFAREGLCLCAIQVQGPAWIGEHMPALFLASFTSSHVGCACCHRRRLIAPRLCGGGDVGGTGRSGAFTDARPQGLHPLLRCGPFSRIAQSGVKDAQLDAIRDRDGRRKGNEQEESEQEHASAPPGAPAASWMLASLSRAPRDCVA